MRIACIGGGPAGLYFAISMKLRDPAHQVDLFERNRRGVTFGWGVVFSDQTVDNLMANDPVSGATITASFAHWDDIAVHIGGECLTSSGHGFIGIGRKPLLDLLSARAEELGVRLHYEAECDPDPAAWRDYDLVIASDGINSRIRDARAEAFGVEIDERANKFIWLGTSRTFDAFTFAFEQTEAASEFLSLRLTSKEFKKASKQFHSLNKVVVNLYRCIKFKKFVKTFDVKVCDDELLQAQHYQNEMYRVCEKVNVGLRFQTLKASISKENSEFVEFIKDYSFSKVESDVDITTETILTLQRGKRMVNFVLKLVMTTGMYGGDSAFVLLADIKSEKSVILYKTNPDINKITRLLFPKTGKYPETKMIDDENLAKVTKYLKFKGEILKKFLSFLLEIFYEDLEIDSIEYFI